MIKTEVLIINGQPFVKTYSSDGFQIRKVGTNEIYDEAIDIEGAGYVYEETEKFLNENKIEVE